MTHPFFARTTLAALLPLSLATGCGSSDAEPSEVDASVPDAATIAPDAGSDAVVASGRDAMVEGEDAVLEGDDFGCILDWPMVRRFRITNVLGHLDETLAVAASETGGTYPVGTVIQLVPSEAMVKRGRGWNPATNDWEFFALDVTAEGTTIRSRGAEETVNAFGGNCFDCHRQAEPQWDLICESTHGCDPLPIGPEVIMNIQNGDARCR